MLQKYEHLMPRMRHPSYIVTSDILEYLNNYNIYIQLIKTHQTRPKYYDKQLSSKIYYTTNRERPLKHQNFTNTAHFTRIYQSIIVHIYTVIVYNIFCIDTFCNNNRCGYCSLSPCNIHHPILYSDTIIRLHSRQPGRWFFYNIVNVHMLLVYYQLYSWK